MVRLAQAYPRSGRFARAFWLALGLGAGLGLGGTQANAADHRLTDVSIDLGILKIAIPVIEIKGSPLDAAGAAALVSGTSGESALSRLEKLTAGLIVIPEFHVDQAIGARRQRTTYTGFSARDVAGGRIGHIDIAGQQAVIEHPVIGPVKVSAGLTTSDDIDLPLMARVLTVAAKPGETLEFQTLYRSYEVKDYVIDLGAMGSFKIAAVKGSGARMRQARVPVSAMLGSFMALAEKQAAAPGKRGPAEPPSPDEMKTLSGIFELLQSFEYGDMEAGGLTGTFTAPGGQGQGGQGQGGNGQGGNGQGPTAIDLKLARIFFSDKPGQGVFRLDGFELNGGPVKARLDSFSASDFSFGASLKLLADAFASDGLESLFADNPLKLIPKLGSIKMAGLLIEAPDENVKGATGKPEKISIGLRASEATVGAQKDGIPTAVKVAIDGLTLPISPFDRRSGMQDLAQMGYKSIDMSGLVQGAWNEPRQEFAVDAISLSGVDMGRVTVKGQLGNITADVFSGDKALAQVALLGASVKTLEAEVKDDSLFGRILAREAGRKKKSAEDLRKEYGTLAAVSLPAIIGSSEGAKAITSALSRFIARPGTLKISASARSGSGIGLADVIAIGEPQAIFDKLDVKASAE